MKKEACWAERRHAEKGWPGVGEGRTERKTSTVSTVWWYCNIRYWIFIEPKRVYNINNNIPAPIFQLQYSNCPQCTHPPTLPTHPPYPPTLPTHPPTHQSRRIAAVSASAPKGSENIEDQNIIYHVPIDDFRRLCYLHIQSTSYRDATPRDTTRRQATQRNAARLDSMRVQEASKCSVRGVGPTRDGCLWGMPIRSV